jgi:hypothetical protein
MHCTSNLLGKKDLKNDPTIKKGKIRIPFIQLGVRPTSTPGPRRDQLVPLYLMGHFQPESVLHKKG